MPCYMDSGTLPEVQTRFFELDLVIESDIGDCQVLLTLFIMRKLITKLLQDAGTLKCKTIQKEITFL